MNFKIKETATKMMLAAAMFASPALVMAETRPANGLMEHDQARLAEKIRHELVLMPFYGVFDNISFRVEDGKVTLLGHVTRPTLKSSAERIAAKVEGVSQVDNQIEVLPLSPFDDRIRLNVLRAVYGQSALNRYALGVQAPIRIIVKNGTVMLEGIVNNETDRNIANIQANGVFGVFEVKNNLRVENPKAESRKA